MSLLEQLQQHESAVIENVDMNLILNTLNQIQESCPVLSGELDRTPAMVPVVKLEGCGPEEDCDVYCIDSKDFKSMLNSQDLGISDGIEAMFEEIKKDNPIETTCEMAIVIKEESVEDLRDAITSDPTKLNARCEAVAKHVDFINAVLETGCKIYLN